MSTIKITVTPETLGLRQRAKSTPGSRVCECGRTVSGNKLFCRACVEKYTAIVQGYVQEAHDVHRADDDGMAHA